MAKFIEPFTIFFYIVVTGFYLIELYETGFTSLKLYQYLVVVALISAITFRIRMYLKK